MLIIRNQYDQQQEIRENVSNINSQFLHGWSCSLKHANFIYYDAISCDDEAHYTHIYMRLPVRWRRCTGKRGNANHRVEITMREEMIETDLLTCHLASSSNTKCCILKGKGCRTWSSEALLEDKSLWVHIMQLSFEHTDTTLAVCC